MRNIIKKIYKVKLLGKILTPLKILYDYYRFRLIPEKVYLRKLFEKNLGYKLDLENPITLNSKLQWLKLNDRTPLHTQCADKYLVRDYVKNKIGEKYLIPLLYQSYNIRDIIPQNLGEVPYIIKTNHDSEGAIIVRNQNDIDWNKLRNGLKSKLKKNYYYRGKEWQYLNIKPCVVIEKLLLDENNEIPCDYKLHCFNGRVEIIQVDTGRFNNHERHLHDRNWELINCQWCIKSGKGVEKPSNINEMIKVAEKLSEEFVFARIDLYSIKSKLYFGEITFHPGGGNEFFKPVEYDYIFGKKLKI
jgi:hypothetical protein